MSLDEVLHKKLWSNLPNPSPPRSLKKSCIAIPSKRELYTLIRKIKNKDELHNALASVVKFYFVYQTFEQTNLTNFIH